jgi:hypothetical protein
MGHREVITGVLNGEDGVKKGVTTTSHEKTYTICHKYDINGIHSHLTLSNKASPHLVEPTQRELVLVMAVEPRSGWISSDIICRWS